MSRYFSGHPYHLNISDGRLCISPLFQQLHISKKATTNAQGGYRGSRGWAISKSSHHHYQEDPHALPGPKSHQLPRWHVNKVREAKQHACESMYWGGVADKK